MPEQPPDQPRHIFAPGFVLEQESADRTALAAQCFTRTDGVHFCPARTGAYGMWGRHHVLLTYELGRNGLFVAWTPEGAREAAQILLDMAARAEANLAEDAAAQLAATLGKGKPA
jgi:hypothetical protein